MRADGHHCEACAHAAECAATMKRTARRHRLSVYLLLATMPTGIAVGATYGMGWQWGAHTLATFAIGVLQGWLAAAARQAATAMDLSFMRAIDAHHSKAAT